MFDTGMPYKTVDPGGHATTYGYDAVSSTYLTSTTNALGQSVNAAYDLNTGLMTSFKDLNGSVTGHASTFSYDNLGRIKTAAYPDGGSTTFTYTDSTNEVERTQLICSTCNNPTDLLLSFDGLGRQIRSEQRNGNTSNPWDQADTCYDNMGRVVFSTYSYQGAGFSGANRVCPGGGTTLAGDSHSFDTLSRPLITTHSDGSTINTTYTGRAVQTRNEGHIGPSGSTIYAQNISQMDALGRLTSVCEISGTTLVGQVPASCGLDITGTGFLTSYSYSPLNDLLSVQQTGLPARTFVYDSFSRLSSSSNPESGTTSYVYNLDNVLQSKTDGQGDTVTYNPSASPTDALHRVTKKTYTHSNTPTVTYAYDTSALCTSSGANCLGHMVAESTLDASNNPITSNTMYKFDTMERLLTAKTCLYSQCGTSPTWREQDYTYDYLGSPLTSTDGAGNSYGWTPDVKDRPTAMTASYSTPSLLSGIVYGAFGMTSANLGNGHVLQHGYDTRGRLQSVSYGVSGSAAVYSDSLTYAPDSNISSATDSVTGSWTYQHDEFNRAVKSVTSGSGWASGLTLTWGYDRYGNRLSQTATGTSSIPVSQPSIGTTGNRINGYCYDGAGRLEDMGGCASPHLYNYDDEGRLSTTGNTTYVYDAEGRRAAKLTGSSLAAAFLYDIAGNPVAEFNGSLALVHADGFLGFQVTATWTASGAVSYAYGDTLGTKRYQTSASGAYQNSWGSLPYGDSQTPLGSGADATEQHLTSKERDAESGLDYFGARYYGSNTGRFMSPDWADKPAAVPYSVLGDPQSLNLYSYVRNNPLSRTDADGHVDGPNDIHIGSEIYGSGGADAFFNSPERNSSLAITQQFWATFFRSGAQQQNQTQTVTVIVTSDTVAGKEFGSHAAIWLDNGPDGAALYDPGGSYHQDTRGTGGVLTQEDDHASLQDYIKYQESSGSKVSTVNIKISAKDEATIYQHASDNGERRGLHCAADVSRAVSGVGPFKNVKEVFLPGTLLKEARSIAASQ